MSRAAFIETCQSYVGTPYLHQGRMPGVALDCLGLVICGLWDTGIKPRSFDIQGYGPHPDGTMLAQCREHMSETKTPRAGCVAVFEGDMGPRHLGVLFDYAPGHLGIVHARAGGRHEARVVAHRLVLGPHMRLTAAFEVPGVD